MKETAQGLQSYLSEIGSNPVLKREEEIELFMRVEAGDEAARETVIECNLKFVIQIAHKFRSRGMPMEDLIQEGNIGLLEAVKKFDYRLGYRFSTYAAFWIRQAIQVAVRQRGSLIRLPMRKSRLLGFMSEVINEYWATAGRPPTEHEVAERLEITVEQAQELARIGEAVLSLDSPIEENGSSLMDLVPDEKSDPVEQRSMDRERQRMVSTALDQLSERESTVLRERFGFRSGQEPSLRKVSAKLGLSQEGVRRIEQRALGKLRRNHVRQTIAGLI